MKKNKLMVISLIFMLAMSMLGIGVYTSSKAKHYKISLKSGTYSEKVCVTVKADKGYKVYYTTGNKLSLKKVIKSGKTASFTFSKTGSIRLYAVKNSTKMTAKKIKKIKKTKMTKYTYRIKLNKNTEDDSSDTNDDLSGDSDDIDIIEGDVQDNVGDNIVDNQDNISGNIGDVSTDSKIPNQNENQNPNQNQNSDANEDEIVTDIADVVYDEIDYDISESDAISIVLPASAPEEKIITDNYEISKKNKLTITKPGKYIVSAATNTVTDGLIEVDYPDESITGMVHLILKDMSITSSNNTSPDSDKGLITIKSNVERAVITLAKDSTVTLIDTGATGIDEEDNTSVTYTGGIICKKTPLTINGEGNLLISSVNGNGIKCTDTLKLVGCNIKINGENENGCGNKGIVAKENIAVKDAVLDIVSKDDAVHSNGNIRIDSGNIEIAAGDDGIHADSKVEINGGNIAVTESYEGIEGGSITINDGIISIVASDDGMNSAGGNDGSGMMGPGGTDPWGSGGFGGDFGGRPSRPSKGSREEVMPTFEPDNDAMQDAMAPENYDMTTESGEVCDYQILINDGTINIDAEGDGIDSNGNLFFKGGTVIVNGPTRGGNGAIDCGDRGCVCEVTGGTLIAAGAAGMDITPQSTTQQVINVRLSSAQSAGTKVAIKDKDGNIVMEACPEKSFQSVVMSSSDLVIGETYTYVYGKEIN